MTEKSDNNQVSDSVCNVTLVSVSSSESERNASGYAERLFREADTTLVLTFGGQLAYYARRHSAKRVVTLSDFRKLDSTEEKAIFLATNNEISRMAVHLNDVKLSRAEIGSAWAIGLRPQIFREFYAAFAIDQVLSEGSQTLTILVGSMSLVERAVIARLQNLHNIGKIQLNGLTAIKNQKLTPMSAPKVAVLRTHLRRVHQRDNSTLEPPAIETLTGDFSSLRGEQPSAAELLILHFSDNPMFLENIPPILDALKNRKIASAVLMTSDVSKDIYKGRKLGEKANVCLLNSRMELKDPWQISRLEKSICERVENCAFDIVPLTSWTPLFAVLDSTYMERSLKRLVTFQAALNVMIGRTKAKAIFMTLSPDSHPLAFLAVSVSNKRMRPFYCFSTFLTQGTRSLPFISPAVLLAGGQHEIDIIRERNVQAADAAILTGSPSLDKISELVAAYKEKGAPERPVVTVITTRADTEIEDQWIIRLVRWAADQDVDIILTENSRSGTKTYDHIAGLADKRDWGRVNVIKDSDAVSTALITSDVIITDQPSLAFAGVQAGTMIIQAAFNETEIMEIENGIGFVASNEKELIDILQGVLLETDYIPDEIVERRNTFLSRLSHNEDNSAAEKVVDAFMSEPIAELDFSPFLEVYIPNKENLDISKCVKPAKFI